MKKLIVIALLIGLCGAAYAQNKEKFIGTWDFTAPTGEVGFESGVVKISQDTVVTKFTGIPNDYPSDWVKYESDTLKYNFYVEGVTAECYLVVKDDSNLTGYATWGIGESVLKLIRQKPDK